MMSAADHRLHESPSTDRLQEKHAKLRAQRARQLELRQCGVATTILLHATSSRTSALWCAFHRWVVLPQPDAPSPRTEPATGSGTAAVARIGESTTLATQGSSAAGEESSRRIDELQTEIARLHRLTAEQAHAHTRERIEWRLARQAIEEEAAERMGRAEREMHAMVTAHLHEKEDLTAAHARALRSAEFHRLDLLAQQEARARARESARFSYTLAELKRMQARDPAVRRDRARPARERPRARVAQAGLAQREIESAEIARRLQLDETGGDGDGVAPVELGLEPEAASEAAQLAAAAGAAVGAEVGKAVARAVDEAMLRPARAPVPASASEV